MVFWWKQNIKWKKKNDGNFLLGHQKNVVLHSYYHINVKKVWGKTVNSIFNRNLSEEYPRRKNNSIRKLLIQYIFYYVLKKNFRLISRIKWNKTYYDIVVLFKNHIKRYKKHSNAIINDERQQKILSNDTMI